MLNIVNSYTDIMKISLDEKNYPESIETLNSIKDGIKKLNIYVSKLIQENIQEVNKVNIKLIPFLNSLINFIKPQSIFSSIRFVQNYQNREIMIRGDDLQLQQVFINLFKNSAEATKKGIISISVDLIDENKKVQIKITDNGPGIPTEIMEKVFNSKVSTKEMGHGYGLIIVKKLIEQNGGTVQFVSKLNQGTEVTLTFPCTI
jgi:two-component system sporulation sensor kinase A